MNVTCTPIKVSAIFSHFIKAIAASLLMLVAITNAQAQCIVAGQSRNLVNQVSGQLSCADTPLGHSVTTGPIPITISLNGGKLVANGYSTFGGAIYCQTNNLNPQITIDISPAVASVDVTVFNEFYQTDTFTLSGGGQTYTRQIPGFVGDHLFVSSASGISSVTISSEVFNNVGYWNYDVAAITVQPFGNGNPQAGTITANPISGVPGSTVTVTGTGWTNTDSGSYFQIAFDGTPVLGAVQGPLSCFDQPNITFDVPCTAAPGSHSITCQLVNTPTQPQQVIVSSSTNFDVTSPISVSYLTSCPRITVSFSPIEAVVKGGRVPIRITIQTSSPKDVVSISVRTIKGTGQAKLYGNSDPLLINASATIDIEGVVESSTADNIEIQASLTSNPNQIIAREAFSVLWVELDIRTTNSDKVSTDNSKLQNFINCTSSDILGFRYSRSLDPAFCGLDNAWGTAVEIVGKVMPPDFRGQIIIARERTFLFYETNAKTTGQTDVGDTSFDYFRDDYAFDSNGMIYDLDMPVIKTTSSAPLNTTIYIRNKFKQFAIYGGQRNPQTKRVDGGVKVSSDLFWYSYIGVKKVQQGPGVIDIPDNTYAGDNTAGKGVGTTRLKIR